MPIYSYDCERCGPFTAMQPMARFQHPCPCPECGTEAPRTTVSAPAIASTGRSGRSVYQAAEPSDTHRRPSAAAHPAGCGCCTRRLPLPAALSAGGRVFTSQGPVRRSKP